MRCSLRIPVVSAACLAAFSVMVGAVRAEKYEGFTDPFRSIEVSAAAEGRIAEVFVKRGDHVRRGDLLMVLDTGVLEATREVAKSRAQSDARLRALEVQLRVKERRAETLLDLRKAGAGSQEEVDRAQADAEIAGLDVAAAKEERRLAQLQLAEIEARLEDRRIRSPIDGVVTDVLKDVGEFVSTSDRHIATAVQLEQLRMTFYLPTHLAESLDRTRPISVDFPGIGRAGQGQLEHVSAVTQADSGRVRVDVLIDNPHASIRSGIRCAIEFDASTPRVSLLPYRNTRP